MGHGILLTIMTTTHVGDRLGCYKVRRRTSLVRDCIHWVRHIFVYFLAFPSTEEQSSTVST